MRCRYAAAVAALAIVGSEARADIFNYYAVQGPTFNFSYSIATEPFIPGFNASGWAEIPSYSAAFGRQAAYLALPEFDKSLGRLNSIRFTGAEIIAGPVQLVHTFVHGDPFTPLDPFEMRMYGNQQLTGTMKVFAEGNTLGAGGIDTFIFPVSCRGSGPGSTTCSENLGDFVSFNTFGGDGEISPETAFILAAFDDVEIAGRFEAEIGIPKAASYSGVWSYRTYFDFEYDYTPVSQVPLPGAALLFLSSLIGLAVVAFKRGSPTGLRRSVQPVRG